MKKFFTTLFCLTALAGFAVAGNEPTRADIITRLDSAEAILQDLQGNVKTAIPADVLRRAKGIVIVNQFQAGFLLAVKDGYAVALARRPNGKWSVPAFLRAGEISFGFQAGGKAINAVYVLMDDSTIRLLFKDRFNFGVEAKAAAGIRTAEAESVTKPLPGNTASPQPGDANVFVYSTTEGYYLGAALKTGFMSPDDVANRGFYNSSNRLPELLFSDWVSPPPETHFLMDYVTRLTQ